MSEGLTRRQRQTIGLGIVFFCTVAFIAGFFILQIPRFELYDNPQARLKIKYPKSWTVNDKLGQGAVVAFLSPKQSDLDVFLDNVNIVVQDLSRNPMTIEQYNTLAIQQLTSVFNNLTILESHPVLWAGHAGHKLVYFAKGPMTDLKVMHVWMIDNNKAYQFTYTAVFAQYDKYVGLANTMVQSFTLY